MIDKSEQYLLDLFLASVSKDYIPSNDIEGIDFSKIYKLASLSRVTNCVYYGLLKLDKETLSKISNLSAFKNECLIYGVKERVQESDIVDIINAFNKENIDMIFFKGYVLKYIYPKLDMRVMGDIDFLVKVEDISRAQKAIESIGFKKDADTDFNVEVGYIRNSEVELHKKLSVAEIKYFDTAFDHKVKFLDYPNTYTLDTEYHFIYLLSHAHTHMIKGGLGIKYPMDFYLFLNKYDIDFKKIKEDLETTNLDKFAKLILFICHKWFNLDLSKYQDFIDGFEFSDEEIETFELFMLYGGEYGMFHDRYSIQNAAVDNKFKYLLSKIFRPFRFVCKTDHPKWWQYLLLPYYYVRHWFNFFIIKGFQNIKKAQKFVKKESDAFSSMEQLFVKIGTKKDSN